MAKTIDLTPTWVSLVRLFLTLMTEQPNNKELLSNTIDHFTAMARAADEYVALAKAAGMYPNSVDTDELIARVKQPAAAPDDAGEQRHIPDLLGGECAYPDKLYLSRGGAYIRTKSPTGWNIAEIVPQPPYTLKTAEKLVLAYNYHDLLVRALSKAFSSIETIASGQWHATEGWYEEHLTPIKTLLNNLTSE